MKTKAILMTIAMMSAALAGCTGSDGVAEIDDETLQELFDDNIQDFMNNTSVTVNQEIHYHNNTTVNNYETTNEYSNTTNVDGGEVVNNYENNYSFGSGEGNGSGGSMYLLDIQFTLSDLIPDWSEIDYRNNTVDYWFSYYDYLANEYRTDLFTIQCSDYYLIGSNAANGSSYSYWQSSSNYRDAWSNVYNDTISDLLAEAAYEQYPEGPEDDWGNSSGGTGDQIPYPVRTVCDEDFSDGRESGLLLFEIPIPEGVALRSGASTGSGDALNEYVWATEYTVQYDGSSSNCYYSIEYYGEYSWEESYYPSEGCANYQYGHSAFDVYFEFETINWYFGQQWVGGDDDSVLEVYANNIYPNHEYRLIAYFIMSPVVALE
jgi:hypothetical protein